MKKKLLAVLLIIVLVFNFIGACPVYADPDDETGGIPPSNGEGTVTPEQANELVTNGKTSSGGSIGISDVVLGFIFQVLSIMFNSFPMAIHVMLNALTTNPESSESWFDKETLSKWNIDVPMMSVNPEKFFTIQRTVFNEVALLNVDVFNMEPTYTVGTDANEQTINQPDVIIKLKESTAGWFYVCRLFAMMINLCVLIYVGIRMAISTVASEEARYKKMLISWAESMVLLFFLHYIMDFALDLGNGVLNIIYNLKEGMGAEGFEITILEKVYNAIFEKSGMQIFMYSLFYWVLMFLLIKFFLMYFRRVLTVMFLTIIAPFITVTYPIDKMGDQRAQAFEAWWKEYIINIAIQPIHAAIYLVFVFSAGVIAEKSPLVAMIFLLVLGRIEKIVRSIFGVADSVSVHNVGEELRGRKGN